MMMIIYVGDWLKKGELNNYSLIIISGMTFPILSTLVIFCFLVDTSLLRGAEIHLNVLIKN